MDIKLENGEIKLLQDAEVLWSVKLTSIRGVFEYTTEEGPGSEDHFTALVDGDGVQYSFPVSSNGFNCVIEAIKTEFGFSFDLQLLASTEVKSYIHFPVDLKGENAYEIVEIKKGISRFFGFSHEAKLVLNEKFAKRCSY